METEDALIECRAIRSSIASLDHAYALRGLREVLQLAERFYYGLPEEDRAPFAAIIIEAKRGIADLRTDPPMTLKQFRVWFSDWAQRAVREWKA